MHNPVGMIYVVDPSPLNWLYILFNTMEEPVRADHLGRLIPSLATKATWLEDNVLELELRKTVYFQNREPFNASTVSHNFNQMQLWFAPHPPGTWLNLPQETTLEIIDPHTVRFHFPQPEGLALFKMRAFHQGNLLFWQSLGFGYATLGTGEGRW